MTSSGPLKPTELLRFAGLLAQEVDGYDEQVGLRRAVSTAYYGVFHHLAQTAADLLIGETGPDTSRPAWNQAYRALEHGAVYTACRHRQIVSRFPRAIQDYAETFVTLQDRRVLADYDPLEYFDRSRVLADCLRARLAISTFDKEPEKDRRAFCAYVVLKQPRLRSALKQG